MIKKSELLKRVLENFNEWREDLIFHLCNRIEFAANGEQEKSVAKELRRWIAYSLITPEGEYLATVGLWLRRTHNIDIKYAFNIEEMMEYRRLWLIDMIGYWESLGE